MGATETMAALEEIAQQLLLIQKNGPPMFSLTNEERRIVVFVLSIFLLGMGMKFCREKQTGLKNPASTSARPSHPLPSFSPPAQEDAVPNPD